VLLVHWSLPSKGICIVSVFLNCRHKNILLPCGGRNKRFLNISSERNWYGFQSKFSMVQINTKAKKHILSGYMLLVGWLLLTFCFRQCSYSFGYVVQLSSTIEYEGSKSLANN
jgi:hypothetical protein